MFSTLSKTLKTCLRSSSVSFSVSLLAIKLTNSWKSTVPESSLSASWIKEVFTKDTYGITWHDITSIISSSSSSVGYNPIDLITAPSSFVETVPSPSCVKGLNKQTIFKQSCKITLILLVTKRLFRRNLIIQNLHIDM